MASVNPVWTALAARWDQIAVMFDGEVGSHWARTDKCAEGTNDLMRNLIDSTVAAARAAA